METCNGLKRGNGVPRPKTTVSCDYAYRRLMNNTCTTYLPWANTHTTPVRNLGKILYLNYIVYILAQKLLLIKEDSQT